MCHLFLALVIQNSERMRHLYCHLWSARLHRVFPRYVINDTIFEEKKNVLNERTNSVVLVRERTIQTERPPPVGEVSANFFAGRGVSRGQRNGSPRPF
jgi:hypothetical protein